MSKIKLTKGELKKQRDALTQFRRYLPTLQLKKQQLQMKIREIQTQYQNCQSRLEQLRLDITRWNGLLGDCDVSLEDWVIPQEIQMHQQNIAGVNLPSVKEVVFADLAFDFYSMPVWVDRALEKLRDFMKVSCEVIVFQEAIRRLEKELRVTSQRVNLFEKVKIPESLENIRLIRIYLGDQQANAVGIGKVAKKKIEEQTLMVAEVGL